MRKFKLICSTHSVPHSGINPKAELAIVQPMLKRFITEEKYELAGIIKERIEFLELLDRTLGNKDEFT